MTTHDDFDARAAALRAGLRAKLGVRGKTLPHALKRARRVLPPSVRAANPVLIEAQQKMQHPKIARQVDGVAVDQAFKRIESYLAGIDPAERRKDARLRWLALLILKMALLGLLLILLVRWRGYA